MTRRQGAVCVVLIGACSQRTILRRATANRPGPFSMGSGRAADSVCSEGTSQYGLSSATDRFALALGKGRSPVTPVIDNLRIAPICSWKALIVPNILRANQTPVIKKAS
jgi:hypothetical protein